MIRRRHLAPAAAAVSAALALAGCAGSGGGTSASAGDSASAGGSAVAVSSGVGAAGSANQAIAALGTPGSVDPQGLGSTLSGYDRFGTPHNAFNQQVRTGASAGSEPTTTTAEIPPSTPINTNPIVAVPGGTGSAPGSGAPGGTPTPGTGTPGAGGPVPVQRPRALEADFDVSGQPVVAREGDAIPPDTQQFVVETIAATSVTLKLSGGLLPDGKDTVKLDQGKSITLYNATARRSYKIKLVDVRPV